jgi:carboxymethylenebutenolidase
MQQHVTLPVADGPPMQSYTVVPEGKGPFPALILIQEAFGVNHHIRQVAERLAAEGFAVIAPEIFHRTAPPGFEGPYNDFAAVMPHYQAITNEGLSADMTASYQWLQLQPSIDEERTGCIGFCLGGRVSFVANAVLPLAAGVSYYGGGLDQVADMATQLHGPHLFFWGGLDTHLPLEVRQKVISAVEGAGKPYVNVVISYAGHAFNSDERPSYHPEAASEAWAMTLAFLRNKLGVQTNGRV